MRDALDEREELIEARADAVLAAALEAKAAWVTALGAPPREHPGSRIWRQQMRVIAAYRDRYAITGSTPLGGPPQPTAQKIDHARADGALRTVTHYQSQDHERRPAQRVIRVMGL